MRRLREERLGCRREEALFGKVWEEEGCDEAGGIAREEVG